MVKISRPTTPPGGPASACVAVPLVRASQARSASTDAGGSCLQGPSVGCACFDRVAVLCCGKQSARASSGPSAPHLRIPHAPYADDAPLLSAVRCLEPSSRNEGCVWRPAPSLRPAPTFNWHRSCCCTRSCSRHWPSWLAGSGGERRQPRGAVGSLPVLHSDSHSPTQCVVDMPASISGSSPSGHPTHCAAMQRWWPPARCAPTPSRPLAWSVSTG